MKSLEKVCLQNLTMVSYCVRASAKNFKIIRFFQVFLYSVFEETEKVFSLKSFTYSSSRV